MLFSVTAPGISFADDIVVKLQAQAAQQKLWQRLEWLNLVHYQGEGDAPGNYVSEVDDDRFFNAEDGKNNPDAELAATLAALFNTEPSGNENAQCRFVARLIWLHQQLQFDLTALPAVTCADYLEWRKVVQPTQVTLIFPAYHLNSPSSMFGHTLLRLDRDEGSHDSDWLSSAVNFGAEVNDDDNSLLYAYKGLFGGYPGLFITEPYFKKIQEYNRIEHRDIWEYPLNLTPQETERMVTHLWELKGINFDYYFFNENCSYRLLELLEVARPGVELTDEFKLSAIPVDTVRAIESAGMIESVNYRPSQATVLQHLLDDMPDEDHELVAQLSADITFADDARFTALTADRQRNTVDAAYRFLRYQQVGKARDPVIAKRSYQLLAKLNSFPSQSPSEVPAPIPPEQGHGSKRTTFGLGRRLDNDYAEFGFRMSFHSLEDNEAGFLRGAQINLGSLQLRAVENESLILYQLDLVDIFSLTPRTRFFNPLSWRVYAGLERELTNGVDQLVAQVTGGAGVSYPATRDGLVYALATARLESNKQLDHPVELALGGIGGLLWHFGPTTARLEVSGEQFTGGVYRLRTTYEQNFVLSTNHSIRLSAQYEWQENNTEFSDVSLNYQYYF
jgi:hypothetical protein